MAANLESSGAMQMCANHFNDLSLGSFICKVITLLSGAPQIMRTTSDGAQEGYQKANGECCDCYCTGPSLLQHEEQGFAPDTEYAS